MDPQPGPSRIKDSSPERPKKKYKIENLDDVGFQSSSVSIDDLPDEILIEIFSYLSVQDRMKAQKVCSKWRELVRNEVLWISVKIIDVTESIFIEILVSLPSCVLHLECGSERGMLLLPISLSQLMAKLHEQCPHLKTLILRNIMLSSYINPNLFGEMRFWAAESMIEEPAKQIVESKFLKEENIEISDISLPELKILSFRRISFPFRFHFYSYITNSVLPKITVLDLSHSQPFFREAIPKEPFSTLVDLEELYLGGWMITDENTLVFLKYLKKLRILDLNYCLLNDSAVSSLMRYGVWLEELYLCRANIKHIPRSSEEIFPRLQSLCVRETNITQENVGDLLIDCPSLKFVNVNNCERIEESWYQSLSDDFKGKVKYSNAEAYSCKHFLKSKYYHK